MMLAQTILCLLLLGSVINAEEYKVGTESASSCSNCKTLDEYLSQDDTIFDDSIFLFESGIHFLTVSHEFVNIDHLTLRADNELDPVQINILNQASLTFTGCENITLAYLHINSTGSSININKTFQFTLDHVSLAVGSLGLQFENAYNVKITDSYFNSTKHDLGNDYQTFNLTLSYIIFVLFSDPQLDEITQTEFSITNTSLVSSDMYTQTQSVFGIFIQLSQVQYVVDIKLKSLEVAVHNGINIHINANKLQYNVEIDKLISTNGLFGLLFTQTECSDDSNNTIPQVTIANSVIASCIGVGVSIEWLSLGHGKIQIINTLLKNNTGFGGTSGLGIAEYNKDSLEVCIINSTFEENKSDSQKFDINPTFRSVVSLVSIANASIVNSTVSSNEGTGLLLFESVVKFSGKTNFINNTGYDGGGMALIAGSFIILEPDAYLNFTANRAYHNGGAIHITQVVLDVSQKGIYNQSVLGNCFYRLANTTLKKYFYFERNWANVAGTVIYGGVVSSCPSSCMYPTIVEGDLFSEISTYSDQKGLSIISSNGRDVCFCTKNNRPNCNKNLILSSAIPGQAINFNLAVIGQSNNLTTGTISIYNGIKGNLLKEQTFMTADCTQVDLVITSTGEDNITLLITLSESESNFIPVPKNVSVIIEHCLPGFYLSNVTQVCECSPLVESYAQDCDSNDGTITLLGRRWLSYDNDSNCIINKDCPYNYCDLHNITVRINESDPKCDLDRSGLLCGKCPEGYSLMLGSNQCGICNDAYLTLILVFIIAGIALVIVVIAMNLTVSVGTINGLIFYANIIKIYESSFFPDEPIPLLSQFISWINLDLGIQTCFFAGMDSCTKIGLQFIFPFYIWFLIAIIIFVSHYSVKLSKAIGNNAISVLATLLLLSYTKLLRTIITIFTFTDISCQDEYGNDTFARRMWHFDPNISFWQSGCHLALFVIALAILIVLVVPYTLFLLLFPLLELIRSRQPICTKLYLKLKPFFDAYAGPHNDYFRFWPGLLLVVRVLLALLVALTATTDFSISLSFLIGILTLIIVVLIFCNIYKKPIHSNIDICFLLCLVVIVYITLGSMSEIDPIFEIEQANIGLIVVLSVSLLICLVIIGYYHAYLVVFRWFKKKCCSFKTKKLEGNLSEDIEDEVAETFTQKAPVSTTYVSLREPLLESIT
jgi:predicted outer membrane repeat protein